MNHGSLFSGIGGFDLASEWMGWNNVFHCEWMPFPQKILKHYWPKAISYHDITKTDFTIHRGTIGVLTGGFPCQPYSLAGKRLGKEDERHLWPEMLRAIKEIQPTWVVGENVYGLTNWNGGMVFEEVCVDLENCGYQVQPIVLPACAVNAPHRRDRVWFIAYTDNIRFHGCLGQDEIDTSQGGVDAFHDAQSIDERTTSDPDSGSEGSPRTNRGIEGEWSNGHLFTEQRGKSAKFDNRLHEFLRNATDPDYTGLEGSKVRGSIEGGRSKSNKQSTGYLYTTWKNFPTQSPICGGDDGISTQLDGITFSKWRQESIKGYGNAVVPQLVFEIFKVIEQMNSNS